MSQYKERIYQLLKQKAETLSFDELMDRTKMSDYELMSSLGGLSSDGLVSVSENEGKLFFAAKN